MAAGKEFGVLGISKHGGMGANKMKGHQYGAQTAVGTLTGYGSVNETKQKSMQTNKNKSAQGVSMSMGGHLYGTHHGAHKGK